MLKSEVLMDKRDNGVATLTLNRTKALNSLNLNMVQVIRRHLNEWQNDKNVKVIIIESATDKAFCAGGDMKVIFEAKNNEKIRQLANEFFEEEYLLDELIYSYPKPIIANMNGIIMGGGVGLTYGARYRVITEKTKWAMPEISLGFFPDVGAGYFLNQIPGNIGTYLALTGEMIKGNDLLYANVADYLVPSNKVIELMREIKESADCHTDIHERIRAKMQRYKCNYRVSELEKNEDFINKHFKYSKVEDIINSLKLDDSPLGKKYYELLSEVSPVSLKVILKQMTYYKGKSINESLKMDRILVSNFLDHNDFYEGVRSVLIDKDRNPKYEYVDLVGVTDDLVNSFFNNDVVLSKNNTPKLQY